MVWATSIGDKFQPAEYWATVADTITLESNVLAAISIKTIPGRTLHFNQESETVNDDGFAIVCSDTPTSLTMDPDEVNISLATFAYNTELCDFSSLSGDIDDQREVQIRSLLRKAARATEKQLILGSGSSPNAKGLKNWITSGQTVDNAGGVLTSRALLQKLDQLVTKTKVRSLSSAFIASPEMIDHIRDAMRNVNGFYPDYDYAMPSGFMAIRYRGFPVLPSEFVEANDGVVGGDPTGSVYFVNLDFNGANGFGMVFNPNFTNAPVVADFGLYKAVRKGLASKASEITQLQTAYNFALRSTKAAARLKGIRLIATT